MKTALLFPGQGAEQPGMGLALAETFAPARGLLERAGEAAGLDAFQTLGRGGPALARTEALQPLLVAASLGAWARLRGGGVRVDFVAGHSLGELAAWCAAGGISTDTAIDLAAARGRLMGREAAAHPGGMLALAGGEDEARRALERGRPHGVLAIAARNAPDETVLSGDHAALREAGRGAGATRLEVAGAWHSPLMAGALEEWRALVRAAPRGPLAAGLVCNRAGTRAGADEVPDLLAEQLVRPVEWAASLRTLGAAGVTDWITTGPGRTLRALLRRNGVPGRVHATETPADLDRALEALA